MKPLTSFLSQWSTLQLALSVSVALHAAVLGFHHPILGKTLRFDAPLADDLEALRERLVRGEG